MKKGSHIEVQIQKVGYEGVAVGTIPEKFLQKLATELAQYGAKPEDYIGKKVIVDEGLPGEIIRVEVLTNKKKYIEGRKLETIKKSEDEIQARCPYTSICRGCTWQSLAYAKQLEIKFSHVKEAFTHIGGFEKEFITSILKPVLPCEVVWEYRNKVEFTFGYDEKMQPTLGYHVKDRRFDIFNTDHCDIIPSFMTDIAKEVYTLTQAHRLSHFSFKTGEGFLRNLSIRSSKKGALLNLIVSSELPSLIFQNELKDLCKRNDVNSASITTIIQKKGTPTSYDILHLFGEKTITETLHVLDNELTFEISPTSFFQTNTLQAERLFETALTMFELKKSDVILDLFCGTGVIGLLCAPHVSKVIGVEINENAIADAKSNAKKNNLQNNTEFYAKNVDSVLKEFLQTGEVQKLKGQKIIIDPPRCGLTSSMIDSIVNYEPKSILYISCNPVTQARDLKEFCSKNFTLRCLQPVDMFPHTYHIENIAILDRKE